MEVSELRVGNWIDCEGQYVMLTHISHGTPVEIMKGIPLTDDVLLKLRFERNTSDYEVGHPDHFDHLERIFPVIGGVYQCDSKDSVLAEINGEEIKIYFLHQLQNLLYTLTGDVLIVNFLKEK